MKQLKTLRVRFAFWTSMLLLVILIAFGIYVYGSLARGLSVAIDNSLSLNAAQVVAELDVGNGQLNVPDTFAEEPEIVNLLGRGFTIRILTLDGQTLQALGPYQDLPVSSGPSFTTRMDPGNQIGIRLYTAPIEDNGRALGVVQVAQSLAELQATLRQLMLALIVSVPLLVAVAGIGGYFLAASALAPIDRITHMARRISAEDLSARLNLSTTDDEVGRLAGTFDDMLSRLEDAFQRERQFTADASHELRTPLTAMQSILGVIRQKRRTPDEYEQALSDLTQETDRLRTLAESLLRLARSDQRAPQEVIDLSTMLSDVADSLHPLAHSKSLTLICTIPSGLTVIGDRDDLIRLFVNLLDNAIKYTEHGTLSLTATQPKGRGSTVTVSDTGIGISAEHLPHIFDRFYRADRSRARRGTGLGLAIASAIVRAHSGTIEGQSAVGQGTSITVRFPPKHP